MKEYYHIGTVGIDVCKISISTSEDEINEIRTTLTHTQETTKDPAITVSNNGCKVTVRFDQHKVILGNNSGTRYAHVEIHSSEADGNNLQNLHMSDILDIYNEISLTIQQKYHTDFFLKNKDKAIFCYLELNITFPVKDNVLEYKRIFNLIALAFNSRSRKSQTYKVETTELRNTLRESGILAKCPSYSLRIYDKGQEIFDKLHGAKVDRPLVRFEITYIKKQALITDKLSNPVFQITDQMIRDAFLKKINMWDKFCKDFCHNKTLYKSGFHGRDTTIANIIANSCYNGYISKPATAIFSELLAYENEYLVPCLFDASYLQEAILNLKSVGILRQEVDETATYNTFLNYLNTMPFAQDTFMQQQEKYNEIIKKIFYNDEPYLIPISK